MRSSAQRMIDAWDDDHICPSCIKPCFFAHECNPNDIVVTQRVQNTISNSQLLHYLNEAHNPHVTHLHLQATNPVTLDNVTLYSAKLRNPTQVATMTTALDLGVF